MNPEAPSTEEVVPDDVRATARRLFQHRKHRRHYLPSPLFSEYGWEILLLLFAEEREFPSQKVTRLAERVNAPITTAVRWLNYLEQRSLIERRISEHDRREVLISLTDEGRRALLSYFETLVA